MTTYEDLREFFARQDYNIIIAADAETRQAKKTNKHLIDSIPAGGVAVAFDPIARSCNATYIARGKPEEEPLFKTKTATVSIKASLGSYTLKKLFFTKEELDSYYYGFSNQTLWPLCHVTFERPEFKDDWYEGFVRVNKQFASAIKEEVKNLSSGKRAFIWLNDYQLSLVPRFLGRSKNTIVGMFWHIPWPTWEIFRILPQKKELLESLLTCDFLAFHRGYHVRNFFETVAREFEARIEHETNRVHYDDFAPRVIDLPMGVDADVIRTLALTNSKEPPNLAALFRKYKVILGVDRLDYTKGLLLRFAAIDLFFERYPSLCGNVVHLAVIAPSREAVPSYKLLKEQMHEMAHGINKKHAKRGWKPIHIVYEVLDRAQIIKLYQQAAICLVTPRDDGMNLVSKEFVVSSSLAHDPGMLVLSKFAGSAIDLTESLIINPYDAKEVVAAIHTGLTMTREEKINRIARMAKILDERSVYHWAKEFVESAIAAKG